MSGAWSPNSRDIVIKAIDLNYPQSCRKWASSMNVLIPSRYMPSDYVQSVYLRNICRSCRKPVESGYFYYIVVALIDCWKSKQIYQFKHMFWVLKRTVSWDGSFEYPQHMFRLRNKKSNFQFRTLIWRPALIKNMHVWKFRQAFPEKQLYCKLYPNLHSTYLLIMAL